MSGREYPRKGEWSRHKAWLTATKGPKCVVCGQPAGGWLTIQVNWFRSEDENAKVCAPNVHPVEEVLKAHTAPTTTPGAAA